MAPDGSIAYNESIVKELPPSPQKGTRSKWVKKKTGLADAVETGHPLPTP